MKTSYTIPGLDEDLCKDPSELSVTAAGIPADVVPDLGKGGRDGQVSRAITRAQDQFIRGRVPYNPRSQPRDRTGKFRQILARLRSNLGDNELENIVGEIKKAEKLADVGDYAKASASGREVIKMIDQVKNGVIDAGATNNLRQGAADLGRILAYLPLPQGNDTAKVRFSDLPPSTATFINTIVQKAKDKVDPAKSGKYTDILENFMSGGRTMTSDELGSEMNKLLRVLV